jgi:hypothetical protein
MKRHGLGLVTGFIRYWRLQPRRVTIATEYRHRLQLLSTASLTPLVALESVSACSVLLSCSVYLIWTYPICSRAPPKWPRAERVGHIALTVVSGSHRGYELRRSTPCDVDPQPSLWIRIYVSLTGTYHSIIMCIYIVSYVFCNTGSLLNIVV